MNMVTTQLSNLINGYTSNSSEKMRINLQRLLPHLQKNKFVIVGGLAINYHLAQRGIRLPDRELNDLDILIKKGALKKSVKKDFFIYHRHADNSYFAIVDKVSGVKTDLFDFNEDPAPEKLIPVKFDRQTVYLGTLERQLVKMVYDIQRIRMGHPCSPKWIYHMINILMKNSDLKIVNKLWRKIYQPYYQTDLKTTLALSVKYAKKHPELVKKNPYRKPKPYICTACINKSDFPLDDMKKIYKKLGYTE